MKTTLRNTLGTLLILSPSALAASAPGSEAGFPVWLVIGLFALMIAFQLVPATMMLIGMVRGLVAPKVDLPP